MANATRLVSIPWQKHETSGVLLASTNIDCSFRHNTFVVKLPLQPTVLVNQPCSPRCHFALATHGEVRRNILMAHLLKGTEKLMDALCDHMILVRYVWSTSILTVLTHTVSSNRVQRSLAVEALNH